jgi:hypothetical protein
MYEEQTNKQTNKQTNTLLHTLYKDAAYTILVTIRPRREKETDTQKEFIAPLI